MKSWMLIAAGMLFLCACQQNASSENQKPVAPAVADVQLEEIGKAIELPDTTTAIVPAAAGEKQLSERSGDKGNTPTQPRQIIKKAEIELECKDFRSFGPQMNQLIRSHGAWVEAENETQSDYRLQNVMTLKVPVAKFDGLINGLSGSNATLRSKKIESEDVTNAIVDTRGRLEAKKQIRARYLELLKQAKTMEDILQVQNEINDITEDIESASYNLQHMQAEAAHSTVYLTYYQTLDGAGAETEPGFFWRLWQSIEKGGEGILEAVIGLAALWPLWMVVGAVVYWIRRRRWLYKVRTAKV